VAEVAEGLVVRPMDTKDLEDIVIIDRKVLGEERRE